MQNFEASDRNKEPILQALKDFLKTDVEMKILEVASGTGQHVAHFAKYFRNITWQPTEYDTTMLKSIEAYIDHSKLSNVLKPVYIDITEPCEQWILKPDFASFDAIYNCNMIHISPINTSTGLFQSAGKILKTGGYLFLYGPFAVDGNITPESNVRFDAYLKSKDSQWGLRDTRDVIKLAKDNGLQFLKMLDLPANNKTMVFQKDS